MGGEYVDITTMRELINDSLTPIKEGITKIESNVSNMYQDFQDIKINDALQHKDMEIMKEQIHAQEMTIEALKDKLKQTETNLDKRINELENKDIKTKAKFVDRITDDIFKKIGGVILVAVVIGLCIMLGIDIRNFQNLKLQ